jgi:Ricin-type beta-trefoil lectin domain
MKRLVFGLLAIAIAAGLAFLTPLGAEAAGLGSTATPTAVPTAEHTTLTPDTAVEHMYTLDKHITTKHSCTKPMQTGGPVCDALIRTDVASVRADAMSPDATPSGFGPSDLQSAYDLASAAAADGTGATVAVMEAADDPNLESDLGTYRAQFGLSACTTANGCFSKVNGSGQQGDYPPANSGWGGEASLDVDMVSAICPNCHILVVESEDLEGAQNVAVSLGAKFISNSWGTGDDSGDAGADADFNHSGVVDVASSGDSGFGVSFPASSQYVVAAGGTSLTRDSSTARGWSETAWSGAGAGCSSWETKPTWQTDSGCSKRTVADVSADADPGTGVAFFDSFDQGGWGVVGGTSVASPIIASVFALAGAPSSAAASVLYAHAGALNDITSGSDGTCSASYLCTAGVGYDGPTGLGTPDGLGAFNGSGSGSGSGGGSGTGSTGGSGSGTGSTGGSGTGSGTAGTLVSGVSSNLCVDDRSSSTAGGNPVQIWGCNGTGAQTWTTASNGTIQALGGCLDVTSSGKTSGTKVQYWQCNGTGAQQWTDGSNGSLVNPESGLCLDDPGSSTSWGTQLEIWTCNGGANQEWTHS